MRTRSSPNRIAGSTAAADLCARLGVEPPADVLADEVRRLQARVRALEAELAKSAEGWANAIELDLIPPQHRPTAEILRDGACAALNGEKG